jgi:serine/threonine protein kinase
MTENRRCNRCESPLRSDGPHGICPVCALRALNQPDPGSSPAESSSDLEATFAFESTDPGHVLESLARSIGPIPMVLLPDTSLDDAGVPIVKPSSNEIPSANERGDRYQLFGEIARGGMGAVLKGRDPDLGRDLAVKVLLERHEDKPELVRRFVEEAQIGGQLQHPGIVPVYELGAFADRRPYFTMKLVKGRTLAELLRVRQIAPVLSAVGAGSVRRSDRGTEPPPTRGLKRAGRVSPDPARPSTEGFPSPPTSLPDFLSVSGDGRGSSGSGSAGTEGLVPVPDSLPRFLSIFESICQTIAYAHARGVIHRDLKPTNVMVGSFGEVQVMDWGLAKVLKQRGVAEEEQPSPRRR